MAKPDGWVAFACLNAIGLGVILHVAVGDDGHSAPRPQAEA
jgi:hypothetical protein